MLLTYEGHACFSITGCRGTVLVIDPFLSGNPLCHKSWQELSPQLILLTHGHSDHIGDALDIAKLRDCPIAGQIDLLDNLALGKLASIGFNTGGAIHFGEFTITMTQAVHGSRNADGSYGGLACGYILDDGKTRLYHAGDTALFGDMQSVLSRYRLDYALLPIGGYYTMGPEDAVTAAHWLQAKTIIPMHYNTFPAISQDPLLFQQAIEDKTEAHCAVLAPGESISSH